jgi:hypothetical protein
VRAIVYNAAWHHAVLESLVISVRCFPILRLLIPQSEHLRRAFAHSLSGLAIPDLGRAACFLRHVNRGSSTSTTIKADRFMERDMNGLGGLNNHLKAAWQQAKAFSSEVDTGSRQENAPKPKTNSSQIGH